MVADSCYISIEEDNTNNKQKIMYDKLTTLVLLVIVLGLMCLMSLLIIHSNDILTSKLLLENQNLLTLLESPERDVYRDSNVVRSESLNGDRPADKPKPKVNVENQNLLTLLESPERDVYRDSNVVRSESLNGDRPADKPKPKVNVENQNLLTLLESPERDVYRDSNVVRRESLIIDRPADKPKPKVNVDYKSAKTYFQKSMSEHRTPEVRTIISELEEKIKEQDCKAYVDPVKAEEANEKGNEFFNKANRRKSVETN